MCLDFAGHCYDQNNRPSAYSVNQGWAGEEYFFMRKN